MDFAADEGRPETTRLTRGRTGGGITEIVEVDGRAVMTYGRPKFLKARQLLDAGDWSGTVREAQTTSEVYVKHALQRWSKLSRQPIPATVKSFAFYSRNDALTRTYERLSGDDSYKQLAVWTTERLREHVDRRHRIAHAGEVCGRAEAVEALAGPRGAA